MENNKFEKDGAIFEVRFFDETSFFDLMDLREIVRSPSVQGWMSSVRNMSHKHFGKWMKERGEEGSFLYAVCGSDPRGVRPQRVYGFIYFYPSELRRQSLEVSYAKSPDGPRGLLAPALVLASGLVRKSQSGGEEIVAEIEKGNIASIKTIERAGFVKIRDFDREGNGLWILR